MTNPRLRTPEEHWRIGVELERLFLATALDWNVPPEAPRKRQCGTLAKCAKVDFVRRAVRGGYLPSDVARIVRWTPRMARRMYAVVQGRKAAL